MNHVQVSGQCMAIPAADKAALPSFEAVSGKARHVEGAVGPLGRPCPSGTMAGAEGATRPLGGRLFFYTCWREHNPFGVSSYRSVLLLHSVV